MSISNNWQIVGYLGRAPEIKTSKAGNQYAQCSVGVPVYNNGNKGTIWADVVVYGKQIEFVQDMKKGDTLIAQGELVLSAYTLKSTGEARTQATLIVSNFGCKGIKKSSGSTQNSYAQDFDSNDHLPGEEPDSTF